ncbi:MAG: winged helix-turn-helix domain-containing protein [Planctomycetaceae bacterium]
MVNECRARVRIDQPQQVVEFAGSNGQHRVFHAKRNTETSWDPTVVVEVLSFEPLSERDTTMTTTSKKRTRKTSTTKKAATKKVAKSAATKQSAARKTKPKAAKSDGKLSQLDAAVKVLTEAKEPMATKQMIEAMASKGYWTSPGGKTPAATLYSAILREIQSKGTDARFKKVDKGLFALNS